MDHSRDHLCRYCGVHMLDMDKEVRDVIASLSENDRLQMCAQADDFLSELKVVKARYVALAVMFRISSGEMSVQLATRDILEALGVDTGKMDGECKGT